jgi:hypothetical protein
MLPITYIYVIGQKNGPVKIGVTTSVDGRLSSIKTGCPFPIKVWFLYPCFDRDEAIRKEKMLHDDLAQFRLEGEWFDLEVEETIDNIFFLFDFESWRRGRHSVRAA